MFRQVTGFFASMVWFHFERRLDANQYKVLLIILITFYLLINDLFQRMTLPPPTPPTPIRRVRGLTD